MKKIILLFLGLTLFFNASNASYVKKAVSTTETNTEQQFYNIPRKVIEIQTNRDIYNALKEVYYKSGGDWDMVFKVAKYNEVPKETMALFVKDGKWVYKAGDEYTFPWLGVFLESAANFLTAGHYGGLINCLSYGQFALVDQVPNGLHYPDETKTTWGAGVQQAEYNAIAYKDDRPGAYLLGKLAAIALLLILIRQLLNKFRNNKTKKLVKGPKK